MEPALTSMVQRFFHHDPDQEGMTEEGIAALMELNSYCEEAVKARRKAPQDGAEALNAIVQFELNGRPFTDAEAGSHTSMLVIGGSETFPKVFANALMRLAEHPDQRAELVKDPSGIPDAFNEALRYDMPTQFLGRTLTRDVEIQGEKMTEGQPVIFLYASANHDEREFENPEVFDIKRRAPRMLSFGAGDHQCIGTHVARMEGRICLEELLARFPEYEVDLDNAVRLRTEFVQGFATLPVRIGA